jgi:deoxyribodipyrimidine photo-lyase
MIPILNRYGLKKQAILLESLQDLDNNLRKMGSGLVILKENQVEIPKIVEEYRALKVL